MPSGGRLDRKRFEACGGGWRREGWESLWLSQVPHDGLHFGLEEGASAGLVVHGFQLLHEHGATLYPSVEGLHGGFGCENARLRSFLQDVLSSSGTSLAV